MRRLIRPTLVILSGLSLIALSMPADAHHGSADDQRNMFHHAQEDRDGTNSDLAFWGNLLRPAITGAPVSSTSPSRRAP